MKARIGIGIVLTAAALGFGGCDGRHCGLPAKPDAGATDGAIERIAVVLPEAGTDGLASDRPDSSAASDRPDTRPPDSGSDSNDSSVTVGVTFNTCPNIVASTASPPTAMVGAAITVTVAANDPDPADRLTYAWTAPTGSFGMPAAAGTTYTCAAVGAQTLTVKVSDGQCVQPVMLMVTCTAAGSAGDAGPDL